MPQQVILRPHPALPADTDFSRMGAEELGYFTDAPVSHVVAFMDFERHLRHERMLARSVAIIRGNAKRERRW